MKIIKRLSDNVVLFADEHLELGHDGVKGIGWRSRNIDPAEVKIEEVDDLPKYFVNGGWSYLDGIWTSNSIAHASYMPEMREKKLDNFRSLALSEIYAQIDHDGHIWDAGIEARQLLSQILVVDILPADMYWRDVTGAAISIDKDGLKALAQAIFDRGFMIDKKLMEKTEDVISAATIEEIEAITW